MAHNNKEIEIKLAVDKKTFNLFEVKLKKIAKFEKTSKQKDEYFTFAHKNFLEPKYPYEWLSVRERADKIILNYKHFYPENKETFTHCDEYETEIKSREQLEKIFVSLGLKKLIIVEKERRTYNHNDELEVALDKVKDLGYFIEIETTADFGSVEKARKKIFEFAKQLGLNPAKADKRGYPYLLMKKKSLIK